MNIRASGWDGRYILVDRLTGKPVLIGQTVESFRGDPYIVQGGTAPASESSSGRVEVNSGHGHTNALFYPSVFNLEWVRI